MTARLGKVSAMSTSAASAWVIRTALGLGLLLIGPNAWAAGGWVTVQSRSVTAHITAYARVESIAQAPLQAAQTGQVDGLNVDPGQHIAAGVILGKLKGPEIKALLAQRLTAVDSDQAKLTVARQTLAITQKEGAAHLSTRKEVYKAQAAFVQAKAQLSAARTALQTARENTVLRAPATGTVMTLAVANGERVTAGQNILTLQPTDQLWLKATYYGAQAVAVGVGMPGRFIPADGSAPIPVRVARVVPLAKPDGGRPVALRARSKNVDWVSGEAGTVVLKGARHTAMVLPTRALLLDRSQWWVLVHTGNGDRRQRVTLGASRGHDTLITQGLIAGTQVVVDNAYLKFHRNFSQRFQPPD
jgi:RND family efflux transporter MFP subunit